MWLDSLDSCVYAVLSVHILTHTLRVCMRVLSICAGRRKEGGCCQVAHQASKTHRLRALMSARTHTNKLLQGSRLGPSGG